MGDVKSLKKDGKVSFGTTKYNFLSEAKTTEIFHELFVKHKIVLLPISVEEEKQGQVTQGRYTQNVLIAKIQMILSTYKQAGKVKTAATKAAEKLARTPISTYYGVLLQSLATMTPIKYRVTKQERNKKPKKKHVLKLKSR